MSYTYNELVERMLEHMDFDEIVSVLKITPEDLVDRFEDRIIRNYDELENLV